LKVLFVSSGRLGKPSELIRNQGDSLADEGIDIHYFIIKSGLKNYLKSIFQIRNIFIKDKFDLIHAHYSLSGFAASLAGKHPIVVSLLGSDAYKSFLMRWLTRMFSYYYWDKTIVKTFRMSDALKLKNAEVIPNGVNIERFQPVPKFIAREKINCINTKKLLVFAADPDRQEKNYKLANDAVKYLKGNDIELLTVFNVPNNKMPYYINAADALILTSKREGSVNVVKEAMACNVPVVSSDVGDVKQNTSGLKGCFVCESNPASIAEGLLKALSIENVTDSRNRIIELGLDSVTVAKKIINIYERILIK